MIGQPLPAHLRDSLRLFWNLSHWCNYQCAYCGVPVFSRRTAEPQFHAFDHYPAPRWTDLLLALPHRQIALTITGGEPFVDRRNFRTVLEALTPDPRFLLQIHTNGSWNPEYFTGLDLTRVWLIISFHASQTKLDAFVRRLEAIHRAGFTQGKVVMVLSPENEAIAEQAAQSIESAGWFLNMTAMLPDGAYVDHRRRTEHALSLLEQYGDWRNAYFTILEPKTRNRPCWHPAFSYRLEPDGQVAVACTGRKQNVFDQGWPTLPGHAVPCPHDRCYGCPDMVRSLVNGQPPTLFSAPELISDIHAQRAQVQADPQAFRHWMGEEYEAFRRKALDGPPRPPSPQIRPEDIRYAVPDVPIFGYIDQLTGPTIEARATDRILLSGWTASTNIESPITQVQLTAGPIELATFRDFYARPEVAALFGRPDFQETGWRGYCFIPNLPPGEYDLTATAKDAEGHQATLPSLTLHIKP